MIIHISLGFCGKKSIWNKQKRLNIYIVDKDTKWTLPEYMPALGRTTSRWKIWKWRSFNLWWRKALPTISWIRLLPVLKKKTYFLRNAVYEFGWQYLTRMYFYHGNILSSQKLITAFKMTGYGFRTYEQINKSISWDSNKEFFQIPFKSGNQWNSQPWDH